MQKDQCIYLRSIYDNYSFRIMKRVFSKAIPFKIHA